MSGKHPHKKCHDCEQFFPCEDLPPCAGNLKPLKNVYEKFSHLDTCLSDPEWCNSGEGGAIYGIAGEMWRAIKEVLERDKT